MKNFEIWLEFETVDYSNSDMKNEATNIKVKLANGRKYGINVWTFKFLETIIKKDKTTGDNLRGLYQSPPDLFVEELTRHCIEQTIDDILRKGELEDFLNPSIFINE